MHELPVTESILEIALKNAEANQASSIKSIRLVIGDLSSFIDESIQFYWDIISDDTIAKGAVLEFVRKPIKMKCNDCGEAFSPKELTFSCPKCNGNKVEVVGGDEFFVDSIEIDH